MVNSEKIWKARLELLAAGKIKGTGEYMEVVDEDGNKKQIEIPEEINTYPRWQELGRKVRKREPSVITLQTRQRGKYGRMFTRASFFFAKSQTDEIKRTV